MTREMYKGNVAVAEAAITGRIWKPILVIPSPPRPSCWNGLSARMPELGRLLSRPKANWPPSIWFMAQPAPVRARDDLIFQPRHQPDDGRAFLYRRHRSPHGAGGCDARRTRSGKYCPGSKRLQPDRPRRRSWRLSRHCPGAMPVCRNRSTLTVAGL